MTDVFEPPAPLQTAVLFLVFNRPDTTAQVFEAIRKAQPPRLYVAADGPRASREREAERLAKMPTAAIGAIEHPAVVVQGAEADRYVFDHTLDGRSLRFPYSLLRLPRRMAGFAYRRLKRSFA